MKSLSDIIRQHLGAKVGSFVPNRLADQVAAGLIKSAASGNLDAIKYCVELHQDQGGTQADESLIQSV